MIVAMPGPSLVVGNTWKRLDALRDLGADWDGYGASMIREEIISSAKRLIDDLSENLEFEPKVMPMSNGSLQFEWHEGEKSLELEFETSDSIRYLQWEPSKGVEVEDTVEVEPSATIAALLEWFNGGRVRC